MSFIKKFIVFFIIAYIGFANSTSLETRSSLLDSLNEKSAEEVFPIYHSLFKKNYSLDSEEARKRISIFKANVEFIKDFNSKNSYKLGINQFSDLTDDEFRSNYINKTIPPAQQIEEHLTFLGEEENLETSFFQHIYQQNYNPNWTPYLTTPARDQGDCGSCWAQTTIHAIEVNYQIKYGKSPQFSTQQLVDCDTQSNKGCKGGIPVYALDYIIKNGIAYENAYPYVSGDFNQETKCKSSEVVSNKVVSGYEVCDWGICTIAKWMELLHKGPIIVYMDGDGNTQGSVVFHKYQEGVIDNIICREKNHGVMIVGIGSDNLGRYYIGRNSWGSSWGENGNFRFRARSSDKTCFMEEYALLPIVSETKNPVPPPPVKGCLKAYSLCAYNGNYNELCDNSARLSIPFVHGINIGKFQDVKVFTSENCSGAYYTLKKNFGCLSNPSQIPDLAGKAKSFIVNEVLPPAGCISLYSDSCLSGTKLQICQNVGNLASLNFANKALSYISNTPSFKIFTKPGCQGSLIEFNYDRFYDFNSSAPSLVKNTGSILLNDVSPPAGCVWLYSDYCLSGQKIEICKDVSDLTVYNFSKKTASLKFGYGIKELIIFEQANFKGGYANLNNNTYYGFYGIWMDKWIASFKLVK